MKKHQYGNVDAQDKEGRWVPAIPEPYIYGVWIWRRYMCECAKSFKTREEYNSHYKKHLVYLQPEGVKDDK